MRLQPHLLKVLAVAMFLLWALAVTVVWLNWRSESRGIQEKLRHDGEVSLQAKAVEIEGILKRTYHAVRTISLLPGVRSGVPRNRLFGAEDVVKSGRMSAADYNTVQQLYNHIASSVAVSEVYIVYDGFDPAGGQVPFVMFDQIIVDRMNDAMADKGASHTADTPEQDESEEYADYVRQLDYLRRNSLNMPTGGLDNILPINSGTMRTCDNSQYTSRQHGEVINASGFTMSVPIYDMTQRRFKGLVTAVLRNNVLEAALIGLPMVPVSDAEKQQLHSHSAANKLLQPVNFLLEDTTTGLRIFDRRNTQLASGGVELAGGFHQDAVKLALPGPNNWVMNGYVSQAALDAKLDPLYRRASGEVLVLSLALGLFWLLGSLSLKRQILATEQLRGLAAELGELAEHHDQTRIKLQATLDAIPDVLLELGADGRCHDYRARSAGSAGVSGASHIGKTVDEIFPALVAAVWHSALQEAGVSGSSVGKQYALESVHGLKWFEIGVSSTKAMPEEEPRFIALARDITDRKAAEDEIRSLAFYDALTKLPNRRLLRDRLPRALTMSVRSGVEGALMFIDLDNFKTLNDTQGHEVGDILLQQVAVRLLHCVRENDTVARLGGDEFVIMLENLDRNRDVAAARAETIAEKILAELNRPYRLGDYNHSGTPSIGVTLFGDNPKDMDGLLKQADLAMYQAKNAGRNAIRFFDPAMQTRVTASAALEADLREGIRENQFTLYYQGQIGDDGQISGAEVLVRWAHPRRGLVQPLEFISMAEECGLILPLGHLILQAACYQLAAWADHPQKSQFSLAVNVSVRQFLQPDFVDQVRAVLTQTGADPTRLKLELTESVLVNDVAQTVAKMAALKRVGVAFSLDDFGTGYSSLSYLKLLPLDQLKIDRSFVSDLLMDPKDVAIAKTIVTLAKSLGLQVIAEGVETEAQRQCLAQQGCYSYQGYLFSKPLPLVDFENLVAGARVQSLVSG